MVTLPIRKRRSNSLRRFDWTRDQVPSTATDFQQRTRDGVQWDRSSLGPMAEWPSSLRQMVLLCMADSSASAVLYGPIEETAIIYNEPFASLIGSKHPHLQGQLIGSELADLCPTLESVWQRQAAQGCTETIKNQRVRQDRLGFVEEKTYEWKFVPIVGGNGLVAGSLITVSEENKGMTKRERSKSAVREFGNMVKTTIDHTAKSALRLDEHFSGRSCNCDKLWQATQRMEYNRAKYEKFADYAPVGIVALESSSHSVDWANKAFYDIIGIPPESKDLLSFVHPDDLERVRNCLDMGAFREDSFAFECRLKKWTSRPAVSPSEAPPNPSPAWILVSAYREADQEQQTMCWIIDITAHKNAEQFLRTRMDEALEMKQQKERFIDMISHEIRNPLSAMAHCTDDILESIRPPAWKDANIQESAETIAYCTQHIKNIVGDVLTLSKLDSRLVDICPAPARPEEIVQNALKIFQAELRANDIQLVFEVDSTFKEKQIEWLLFDPNRMLQVLINFVTNAIKVVRTRPERKITVRLSVSTRAPCDNTDATQCVIPRQTPKAVDFGTSASSEPSVFLFTTVEDTGPGLNRDEMSSLFERFAQANPKTESKYGGSGLGLFISRDLTELQGGRIGVASTPGEGSKFVFSIETKMISRPKSLPRVPSIEIPTRLREPSASHSPVITTTEEPLRGPGVARSREQQPEKPGARKVLVCEDNIINQKVLANQLRKRGYEVSTALHGEEALGLLCMSPRTDPFQTATWTSSFDVVLMDIEMPVMDGLTCTKRIREFEERVGCLSRLPIIAVTANARSEHGEAALESGMQSVVTKPYKIEDLTAQIEKVCGAPG